MIFESVHGVIEVFLLWLDSSLSLLLLLGILYYFSNDWSEFFDFNTVFSNSRRCFLRLLLWTFQVLELALLGRLHVFIFFSSRLHLFCIRFFILSFDLRCIFVLFVQSCWRHGLGWFNRLNDGSSLFCLCFLLTSCFHNTLFRSGTFRLRLVRV